MAQPLRCSFCENADGPSLLYHLVVDHGDETQAILDRTRTHANEAQLRSSFVLGEAHPMHCFLQSPQLIGNTPVFDALLAAWRDVVDERARCGLPIHIACQFSAPAEIIRKLLDARPGSALDAGGFGGLTPLEILCKQRDMAWRRIPAAVEYIIPDDSDDEMADDEMADDEMPDDDNSYDYNLNEDTFDEDNFAQCVVHVIGAVARERGFIHADRPLMVHAAESMGDGCPEYILEWIMQRDHGDLAIRHAQPQGALPLLERLRQRQLKDEAALRILHHYLAQPRDED